MNNFKHYSILVILMVLAAIVCSCDNPQYENNTHSPDYASSYTFDIAMLSEWSGNILPSDNSFYLYYAGKEGTYRNFQFNPETKTYSMERFSLIDEPIKGDPRKDDTVLYSISTNSPKIELGKLYCQKLKFDCEQCNDTTETSSYCPMHCTYMNVLKQKFKDQTPSTFECHYYTSGAYNVFKAWEKLAEDGIPQIRVGNGDSFGISSDVSARFNDIPTALMLNAMNFTVDTLGNHSFNHSLQYFQDVIQTANYAYVGSNLKNVPQNLQNVSPYVLIEIPSDNEDSSTPPLIVGIVSALDLKATSTVYPGRFGTLDIDDYCAVIHAIESAYNLGARSFLVLAHVITESKSMIALLNALFSLDDDSYNNFFVNSEDLLDSNGTCRSLIIPSSEKLKETFHKSNLKDIDLSNEANQSKYNDLIRSIRKEIFQQIIGIFGESGDETIVPLTRTDNPHNSAYLNFNPNGVITNAENDQIASIVDPPPESGIESFADYLTYMNILSDTKLFKLTDYQKSCYHNDNFQSFNAIGLECYNLNLENFTKDNPTDSHPIWFFQYPSMANMTAQIRVSVKPEDNFKARVTQFKKRPVLDNSESNPLVIYTNSEACEPVLEDHPSCKYFFDNIERTDNIEEINPELYSSLLACFEDLKKNIDDNQGDDIIKNSQNIIECIYQPTSKCKNIKDNVTTYTSPYIYAFTEEQGVHDPNLFKTTFAEDRSRSTPRTSLAADAILNFFNNQKINGMTYHGAFINAGAVREKDLTTIDDAILRELVPFKNYVVHLEMKPSELVSILQSGFMTASRKQNFGGFPVLSGLAVSVDNNIIKEAWLTDEIAKSSGRAELKYLEPIYLSVKPTGSSLSAVISELDCDTVDTNCLRSYIQQKKIENLSPNFPQKSIDDIEYNSINIVYNSADNSPTLYFEVKTPDGSHYTMMLKLIVTSSNDGHIISTNITKEMLNSPDYIPDLVLVKVDKSAKLEDFILDILTLDYIVTGGDDYNYKIHGIKERYDTYTDKDMRQIIFEYLNNYFSFEKEENVSVCERQTSTSITITTLDGYDPESFSKLISIPRIFTINSSASESSSTEPSSSE